MKKLEILTLYHNLSYITKYISAVCLQSTHEHTKMRIYDTLNGSNLKDHQVGNK